MEVNYLETDPNFFINIDVAFPQRYPEVRTLSLHTVPHPPLHSVLMFVTSLTAQSACSCGVFLNAH